MFYLKNYVIFSFALVYFLHSISLILNKMSLHMLLLQHDDEKFNMQGMAYMAFAMKQIGNLIFAFIHQSS